MNKKVELLSPAGDFDSLKAAVQNGADAVYLGVSSFNARSSAQNFTMEELKKAIEYAHIRNVKIHLALNTLIKNDEFEDALFIAKKAYEYGVDAIIVQDLGLAVTLIRTFPKLPIHASTQVTTNNLNGVTTLQRLGFERVVLGRETSLQEIQYICRNTDLEIETFIHGAICIGYSGQCLLSSMIGARSANRGKCAGPCRLPYELLEDGKVIDNGYLLSARDLCGLKFIPSLIEAGVTSFKIEGRLKSPEYVAVVTRIYRKYIDMYYDNHHYEIDSKDIDDLLQVFNRGNFSVGHLDSEANCDLVYKEKQNNMGIYIGNVSNYNPKKGHITLNLNNSVAIGDSITFENEPTKYRISELMFQEKNIPFACNNEVITIGRMKGNIKPGDKIYKISKKTLSDSAKSTFSGKEFKKIKLSCKISIKKDKPITLSIIPNKNYKNYENISVKLTSSIIPISAINQPLTKDRVIAQLSKTTDTPYEFEKITVDSDDNLYIPKFSELNLLRREALQKLEFLVTRKFTRAEVSVHTKTFTDKVHSKPKISLFLADIKQDYDYSKLEDVDRLYIPLMLFNNPQNTKAIDELKAKFNIYIYLPTVITSNYSNYFNMLINNIIADCNIRGFVFSNIGDLALINRKDFANFEMIANYNLNVFNDYTLNELAKNNLCAITLSPELNKNDIQNMHSQVDKELIVYGKLKIMTAKYCLIGHANRLLPNLPK